MKKIYLILLAIPLLFQSCSKHEENLFDKNASARVIDVLERAAVALHAAPNGWIMDYYPGVGNFLSTGAVNSNPRQWGGFTILMNFQGGDTVVMRSLFGVAKRDSTATSLYQLIAETSALLTFNTFNPIIHYFSHPINADGIWNVRNEGMNGDYEFIIMSVASDRIVLRSKKQGHRIVMRHYTETMEKGEYLATINSWENQMLWRRDEYRYVDGNNTMRVVRGTERFSNSRILTFFINVEGQTEPRTVTRAFVSDLTGIELYEPIELFGQMVTRMNHDIANELFTVPGQTGQLLIYPSATDVFLSETWYFSFSEMGPSAQAAWTASMNAIEAHPEITPGERMRSLSFGPPQRDGSNAILPTTHALRFSSFDGFFTWWGDFGFNTIRVSDDQINIGHVANAVLGNAALYFDAGYSILINMFATLRVGEDEGGKTYTITADDDRAPTWIKLQDDADPNNWYILRRTEVLWPMDN